MRPARVTLLVVLVLVGVPLAVLMAGRRNAPAPQAAPAAVIARHLRAELRRDGATDIRCTWARRPKGAIQVLCSGGTGTDGSLTTLYELGAAAGAPAP